MICCDRCGKAMTAAEQCAYWCVCEDCFAEKLPPSKRAGLKVEGGRLPPPTFPNWVRRAVQDLERGR